METGEEDGVKRDLQRVSNCRRSHTRALLGLIITVRPRQGHDLRSHFFKLTTYRSIPVNSKRLIRTSKEPTFSCWLCMGMREMPKSNSWKGCDRLQPVILISRKTATKIPSKSLKTNDNEWNFKRHHELLLGLTLGLVWRVNNITSNWFSAWLWWPIWGRGVALIWYKDIRHWKAIQRCHYRSTSCWLLCELGGPHATTSLKA